MTARDSKEVFNNGSNKKERIISQTQTKLPIFRWYREKNYFTNIKKHINPWMRQRKKNYFRNAQKNTNQWIKKLKEIYSIKEKKKIKDKATSLESCIKHFKRKIREGPYFICTVCNRILYKNSVMRCINNKYPCQTFFNVQQSFDGKEFPRVHRLFAVTIATRKRIHRINCSISRTDNSSNVELECKKPI